MPTSSTSVMCKSLTTSSLMKWSKSPVTLMACRHFCDTFSGRIVGGLTPRESVHSQDGVTLLTQILTVEMMLRIVASHLSICRCRDTHLPAPIDHEHKCINVIAENVDSCTRLLAWSNGVIRSEGDQCWDLGWWHSKPWNKYLVTWYWFAAHRDSEGFSSNRV